MNAANPLCICCSRPAAWDGRVSEGDSDHWWFEHVFLCDEHHAAAEWWLHDATRIEKPADAAGTERRAYEHKDGAGRKECVL